jgi:hypothetical protein
MKRRLIPLPVAAVVNDVIVGSHAALDAVFKRAGASGDPPGLSHASKWKVWLLRVNDDLSVDPQSVLGRVIEEFMEVDPRSENIDLDTVRANRTRIEETLARYNLKYRVGGRIVALSAAPANAGLMSALERGDFDSLQVEFERAVEAVESDPAAAVTAASSLLEALFRAYIERENLVLPGTISIKPMWSVVQKSLGLDPKDQADQDVQKVLSGMTSLVDGIGSFRTHAGSAHGGGKHRYRVEPRHARLMVNTAHALATFLIETWERRGTQAATPDATLNA